MDLIPELNFFFCSIDASHSIADPSKTKPGFLSIQNLKVRGICSDPILYFCMNRTVGAYA